MNADSWLWISLIAFVVFSGLTMLFIGRRRLRPPDAAGRQAGDPTNIKD